MEKILTPNDLYLMKREALAQLTDHELLHLWNCYVTPAMDSDLREIIDEARSRLYRAGGQEIQKCVEAGCQAPVAWERRTQFNGNHAYCDRHAREEKDFGQEDPSYFYWKAMAPVAALTPKQTEMLAALANVMVTWETMRASPVNGLANGLMDRLFELWKKPDVG